jgi:hypothetical protein
MLGALRACAWSIGVDLPILFKAAVQCWLNPLIAVPYVGLTLGNAQRYPYLAQVGTDSHCTRLYVLPYVVYGPLAYGLLAGLLFGLLRLGGNVSVREVVDFSSWTSYFSALVVAATLAVAFSQDGLEANIAGFIFAPLWLLALGAEVLSFVLWLTRR